VFIVVMSFRGLWKCCTARPMHLQLFTSIYSWCRPSHGFAKKL